MASKPFARVRQVDEWHFVFHSVFKLLGRLSALAVRKYLELFSLGGVERINYYLDRGDIFFNRGLIHDALFCYRQILERNERNVAAMIGMGRCFIKLAAYDRALGFLEKAREEDSSLGRLLDADLVVAYIGSKRYGMAEGQLRRELERVSEKGLSRGQVLFQLAEVLGHQGRHEEAVLFYKEAVELDPDRRDYRRALGFSLQLAGKSEEAVYHLKMVDAKEDVDMDNSQDAIMEYAIS